MYHAQLGTFVQRDPVVDVFPKDELELGMLPEATHLLKCCRNNPIGLTDPSGELAPIAIVALWAAACASAMFIGLGEADRKWGKDPKGYKKHCYVSCFMNRCQALLGAIPTASLGLLWECSFLGTFDTGDLKSNMIGIINSYNISSSCYQPCSKR